MHAHFVRSADSLPSVPNMLTVISGKGPPFEILVAEFGQEDPKSVTEKIVG